MMQKTNNPIGARTRTAILKLTCILIAVASPRSVHAGPPFPDGDECDQCIPAVGGTYVGTTFDNSGDVDDTDCTPGDIVDEWYCITPETTGCAQASLCLSEFDTSLAVFDDCDGTMIACNDDFCGISGLPHWQSSIRWPAQADHTYYVRIGGYLNEQGNYLLDLDLDAGPYDGAVCCACLDVTEGLIEGATDFTDDRWYCYTATCAGRVTASTCSGASFDTILTVLDQCNGDVIVEDDDACGIQNLGSIVRWYVEPGERFPIQVRGYNGATGGFDLLIECDPCFDSPNGDFNNDGIADSRDVQGFVGAIESLSNDDASRCAGDFDHSGTVDAGDIAGMIALLISSG